MTTDQITTPPAASDCDLVSRYVRRRDETAFAELVRRHAPLVQGVCRRVLRSTHDVEDAFQATFLVLARDAHRIVKRRSVASWLHGVAYRTSLRAAESRHRRIRLLQDVTMIEDSTLADVELRHERQKLDEELAGLPEKYREPLVLHYLEGKSNAEIAKLLGLSVSNVEGRLKRGRKELKLRLTRGGIGFSAALAAVQWSQSTAAAAPIEALVGPAIEAGLSYSAGDPAGPLYTHEAARLAGQELIRMSALSTTAATLSVLLLIPMAAMLSGHDGDPGLSPGEGSGPISTVLADASVDAAADTAAVAATSPSKPEISFFVKDGKVFRQTVEELGDVADAGISFTANPEYGSYGAMSDDGSGLMDAEWMGGMMAGAMAGGPAPPRPAPGATAGLPGSAAPQSVYRTSNPEEERIETELESETSFEFFDTPLHDALAYISQLHKFTILIDEPALDDIGVASDKPVNLVLSGISLRSGLKILLEPYGLDTIIEDEVMKVTTHEVAEERREMRVYDTSRLSHIPLEALVKIIESSIPDASWMTVDGTGGTINSFDGGLVVTQDQRTHHKIIQLLELLAKQAAATPGPPATSQRGSSPSGRFTPQVPMTGMMSSSGIAAPPGATAGSTGRVASESGTSTVGPASSVSPPQTANPAHVTGIVTLDGKPLADARIEFQRFGLSQRLLLAMAEGRTDDSGRYVLQTDGVPGCPTGEFTVRITGDTPVGQSIPARYNKVSQLRVEIVPGSNDFNFDLRSEDTSSRRSGASNEPQPAQVEGTVTIDGQPVAGVQVVFANQGRVLASARTDDAGHYQLRSQGVAGCPTGDFEVRVSGQTLGGQAIPARYNSETKLRAKVLPGKNDLDIGLTSES